MPPLFPTISVEAAFTTAPAAAPSWTDISAYAQTFSVRRGRQFELDRMQTGTASVKLDNQDRRFDPTYTSSPYSPNVKPMKRVRIRATWAGLTYPVFAGYAERWPQEWQLSGTSAQINVPLVDGFAVFGYAVLNTTYSGEATHTRINNVLTDIGWGSGQGGLIGDATYGLIGSTMILSPVGDRSIAIGTIAVKTIALTNTSALEHLLAVAASENGLFFMSQDGTATFEARRLSPKSVEATFGDGGGTELPYADLAFEEAPIWNDVRLTANGGVEQTAADSASQTAYFIRSRVQSGFLHNLDSQLDSLASWMVNRYKDPNYRIRSMIVQPQRDPDDLWPQVLNLEIGSRVTINRRPPGGGTLITQESIIEGIEHDVRPGFWTTRYWLSAADTSVYLIISDSVAGLIGTGRLAYY